MDFTPLRLGPGTKQALSQGESLQRDNGWFERWVPRGWLKVLRVCFRQPVGKMCCAHYSE